MDSVLVVLVCSLDVSGVCDEGARAVAGDAEAPPHAREAEDALLEREEAAPLFARADVPRALPPARPDFAFAADFVWEEDFDRVLAPVVFGVDLAVVFFLRVEDVFALDLRAEPVFFAVDFPEDFDFPGDFVDLPDERPDDFVFFAMIGLRMVCAY